MPDPIEVGDHWAYRARAVDPVVQVSVTKIGSSKPPRVRVRFVDDRFEGREEWVPPARLKVQWDDVEAWQTREDRWDAARAPSVGIQDSPELWAAVSVFEAVNAGDAFALGWRSADEGLLFVRDTGASARLLGVNEAVFLADPLAFVDDDGTIVMPWPPALAIAQQAAVRYAEVILRELAEGERSAARRAVYGQYYGGRNPWYTTPEICAEVDRRYAPAHDLLRSWCGEEAVERHDELMALRAEVLRVGQVAERAIRVLEERGHRREAGRLEKELGVPVDLLRASQERR